MHVKLSALVKDLIDHDIDIEYAKNEMEALYIQAILRNHRCNIGASAKSLGIHRNTLTRRMKALKIHPKTAERL